MSNYSSLKATINANIKTNDNQKITGAITNSVLNSMVNALGAGYQYMGVATPTNPGSAQTPDYKCFYIATTPGTYNNLGGLVVADGEVAILKYDSSWTKEVTGAATAEQVNQLGQEVKDTYGNYVENPEWIKVVTDTNDKILYGVKKDGKFYFGSDCPPQVKDYIEDKIASLSLDEYEDMVAFLNDYLGSDTTLKTMIDGIITIVAQKVDKVEGKSLIDSIFASCQSVESNPEYLKVITDSDNKILFGIKTNGKAIFPGGIEGDSIDDVTAIMSKFDFYPYESGPFYVGMDTETLVAMHNSKLTGLAKLCKCNEASFYELKDTDTKEEIYWKINHNFRDSVVWDGMTEEMFMSQLNKYFQIPIFRFCDAKYNDTDEINSSLCVLSNPELASKVNFQGYTANSFRCIWSGTQNPPITFVDNTPVINNGWVAIQYDSNYPTWESGSNYVSGYTFLYEPSSLISDDGQKIELFGQRGYTETSDGINWAEVTPFVFPSGHSGHSHSSVNKVDGIYMMVGASSNNAGTPENPVYLDLFTSTDKINWQWRGHLISTNDDIGSGENFIIMGNSYLFKDGNGTYYLYYEGARTSPKWETCLMTCTDLFADRGNDYIGNWEQIPTNPILPYVEDDGLVGGHPYCNPEFVKGQDNQPLRINGRFYMYYLSGYTDKNGNVQDTLNRMYSYDLINWVEEGVIFDNRDVADGGEGRGDNGDQSMCEFKGKTFLFYTHNMNSYGYSQANIRYTIDDRPITEILKLKP